ncbi:MAG: polysaccharide lyase [Leeuwenhoekiella sp.]
MKKVIFSIGLAVSMVFSVKAQIKQDFNVDFDYPDGTTYDIEKAKQDFGNTATWSNAQNTTIDNKALRVKFTAGLFGTECGFAGATRIIPSQHVVLEYRIKFENGFTFKKGSKLPGLGGGTTPAGGASTDDGKGFTARTSWTKESPGLFNVYTYYIDKATEVYGENIHTSFSFERDIWYVAQLEIKMNSGTDSDGYIKAFIDGKEVLNRQNIRLMTVGNQIDQVSFSTFMGGGNLSFSPDNDQYLWIDYIKITRLDGPGDSSNQPDGYTFIADERETIRITEPVDVAYGAFGSFYYLYNQTSDLLCNSETFGGDPIRKVKKKCFIRRSTLSTSNPSEDDRSLAVYPNPSVNGKLFVRTVDMPLSSISIYNMLGARVYHTELKGNTNTVEIDSDTLGSGVYLLRAIDGDDNVHNRNVIVR